jgi:hypothetical protein
VSPSIVKMAKFRKPRWTGSIARLEEIKNEYRISVEASWKAVTWKTSERWAGNITMDVGDIRYEVGTGKGRGCKCLILAVAVNLFNVSNCSGNWNVRWYGRVIMCNELHKMVRKQSQMRDTDKIDSLSGSEPFYGRGGPWAKYDLRASSL